MGELGDITLNGENYRIDLNTWRRRDLSDFSPRASVPGGASVYNDLLLYQPLVQQDWRHGFGFSWYRDEAGYQYTVGHIDTRHENIVMLFTDFTPGWAQKTLTGFLTWGGSLYAWGAHGLSRYNATLNTWADVYTAAAVNYALGTSDYLFIFPNGLRPYYSETGNADVTPYVKATYTTNTGVANSNLRFTAVTPGTAGNSITVAYQTGASAAGKETVALVGTAITVTLHADSTAIQVMNAMLADVPAAAKVVSNLTGTNNNIKWTAVTTGESGNDISITYRLGATEPGAETVAISGTDITITIHRRTKAAQVIDVVARDAGAAALVTGTNAGNSDGTGKIIQVDVKNTWHKTWQLSDGNLKQVTDLITVELKPGETGAGKPGAMAAVTLAGGAGTQSWVETGVNEYARDYSWVITHNGYVYAGVDGTNQVYYASESDLSDLHGRKQDDPAVILIGGDDLVTLRAKVYGGMLYVAKEDGLYRIGEDNIARRVLDYSTERSTSNFRSLEVYQGYLMFPIRDRIYQWNGSRLSDVTPPRLTDTFPYKTYGQFSCFCAVGRYLYLIGRTNEASPAETLLCWDMVGWFQLGNIIETTDEGTPTATAMSYDVVNNRLWINRAGTTLASKVTYYIPFQALSEYPYADFPNSGSHYVISSKLDMGFRRIQKSVPSIWITASGLSSTTYLKLYYRKDGATAWSPWGGTDDTTNKITTNGVTELTNPTGAGTRSTIEFYYLELRVDFITGTVTLSPILNDITVRFLLRPDTYYGWSFQIVAAGDTQYGMSLDERSANAILTDLETARDSKAPITFVDPWGTSHKVYVTALNEAGVEYHVDEPGLVPNIEHAVQVNLVELR
jgi:hypothetical protein